MRFTKLFTALLAVAVLALGGCDLTSEQDDGRLKVVATTGMVADIVKNIGGDEVAVTTLMGPGIDPHMYKASEGDMLKMANSRVIFFNGLHLEGRLSVILHSMKGRVMTIGVGDNLPAARLITTDAKKQTYDPHIWFDVELWMQTTKYVTDALIALSPENREYFAKNEELYLRQLYELHNYVLDRVDTIPPEKRVLITAHDAFSYFGKEYGFEVLGLQGISTATEAGTRDVQRLADLIAERKIPAVFIETSIPVRNVKALQAAVKARGFDVAVGGELFSDAMGSEGTPEGTYLGMIRHNIDTIANALTKQE